MKRELRFTAIILSLMILITMLNGCNRGTGPEDGSRGDGRFTVVCTVFPQYDWVRRILGDRADSMDLTLLLSSRIDLHSYQPSVDDIAKISVCDLFIYIGGESDGWAYDALKGTVNKNMIVINLLDTLGNMVKEEEILEGMEDEEPEDDDADEDGIEYDEHVWLSLRNAQVLCTEIANALASLDSDNAGEYQSNLAAYIAKLQALDEEYKKMVNAAPVRTLLFGDRFPFRYLMDDYGLTPYAAFSGCSAETEASFDTIVFLAGKVDELGLSTVMVTESADQAIARTIIANTKDKNQQILVLDAMQSVTSSDVRNGTTYLSIMESNLNVLKEALR